MTGAPESPSVLSVEAPVEIAGPVGAFGLAPSWAICGPFETEAALINMQDDKLLPVFARLMRESSKRYEGEQCIAAIRYACIAERIINDRSPNIAGQPTRPQA